MKEHRRGKIILQYVAGILALGLSVASAWFLPSWYSGWRDQEYLAGATFSSREEIEFLDTAALDIAERMELLGQAEQLGWDLQGEKEVTEFDVVDRLSFLQAEGRRWKEAGLLPQYVFSSVDSVEEFYNNISLEDYLFLQVTADGKTLPVCLILLDDAGDGTNVLAIVDAQKDILYFLSVTGYGVQEQMAWLLGFDSLEDMAYGVTKGKDVTPREEYESYDFASIAHAKEAVITGSPGELGFRAELEYGGTRGYGGRMVVDGNRDAGLAIFLGTDRWIKLLQVLPMEQGSYGAEAYFEMEYTTRVWQEAVASELFGLEILSPEAYGIDGAMNTFHGE